MLKTFTGGMHLPEIKEVTSKKKIEEVPLPEEVVLPLIQHTGKICQAKVNAGDRVKTGTLIADSDEFVSSPVHASISGEVIAIKQVPHPVLGKSFGIIIKSDGKDEKEPSIARQENIEHLTPDEIKAKIRQAGIVGLGGAGFPTHVKLSPPKKINAFLLNAAECEPYLTCDHRLMLESSKAIILGMQLLMKTLLVNQGYIGIENNKPDAIIAIEAAIKELNNASFTINVVRLKVKYPQGGEKQLIKAVLGREVPSGGLPYDVGVMVNNVATANAVYEAIYFNKPLYERVVTVSGSCVKEPKNLKVRIGTKFSHLINQCGATLCPIIKVIMGGPMMGIAQATLDVPVIKGTSGVLVFNSQEAKIYQDNACLRCGKCIETCPIKLMPNMIAQAVEHKKFDILAQYHPMDCIECGLCAYACTARRPLVQLIRLAKQKLKEKK